MINVCKTDVGPYISGSVGLKNARALGDFAQNRFARNLEAKPETAPKPLGSLEVDINKLGQAYVDEGYLPDITPPQAMQLSIPQTVAILEARIGQKNLEDALNPERSYSSVLSKVHQSVQNSQWLGESQIVGIHPRASGTFFQMVKYALTLSPEQNAIHVLPFLEMAKDMYGNHSLYAPINWQVNPEFFDPEWAVAYPQLNTPEKQLKAMVNLMHAMGKTVGIDVLQHTDAFSEVAMANPDVFEWYRLNSDKTAFVDPISKHVTDEPLNQDQNAELVKTIIMSFLNTNGCANGKPLHEAYPHMDTKRFFSVLNESDRLQLLFGPADQPKQRKKRRKDLRRLLLERGIMMAPQPRMKPYRPLRVYQDPSVGKPFPKLVVVNTTDSFHTLSPFKLYHLNPDGSLNLQRPNYTAWKYAINHYKKLIQTYGFDFMRADMAHLQPWPSIPNNNPYYNLYGALKREIQKTNPSFAYLGEDFPASRWGNRVYQGKLHPTKHFEESAMDVALGNIQRRPMDLVAQEVRDSQIYRKQPYHTVASAMMTADDDSAEFEPGWTRFNSTLGNTVRAFLALFMPPGYMGMGFEMKGDQLPLMDTSKKEPEPLHKNALTHWYNIGCRGKDYIWGSNTGFYNTMTAMKRVLHQLSPNLRHTFPTLLSTDEPSVLAWVAQPKSSNLPPPYLFVLNTDIKSSHNVRVLEGGQALRRFHSFQGIRPLFSTQFISGNRPKPLMPSAKTPSKPIEYHGQPIRISRLAPGEGRIYKIEGQAFKSS